MKLRDYQLTDVANNRDALTRHNRVLFRGATGSGKTVMFAHMAIKGAEKGNRVCVIVHRRELLDQIGKALDAQKPRLSKNYPMYGVIASGEDEVPHEIQIATIQTLARREFRDRFDVIIIDEAHHAPANQYLKVIEANPNAKVLGVTATPCRMGGYGLGDVFDVLVEQSLSVKELIEQGYLADVDVYSHPVSAIDVSGIKLRGGDYRNEELEIAASTPTVLGDAIKHYREYADGKPAIAFCVSVEHAQKVADSFRYSGIRTEFISGDHGKRDREWRINGLACGSIQVLTSCDLISEGLDVPVVQCGIMLRPTHSLALAMQQMGRVMRPNANGSPSIILDHAGNCLRHGVPQQDRVWTLDKKSKNGPKVRDEVNVNVRQCPHCYYVHEFATACKGCGYVYQSKDRVITKAEGKLEKLTEQNIRKHHARNVVRKARTKEQLQAIAKARGYRPGWVHMQMKGRKR